jgi:hypothetical protein
VGIAQSLLKLNHYQNYYSYDKIIALPQNLMCTHRVIQMETASFVETLRRTGLINMVQFRKFEESWQFEGIFVR